MATTFMESGTDATQDLSFYASSTGTVSSTTAQKFTGTRSINITVTNSFLSSTGGLLDDTGSQISFYFRTDVLTSTSQFFHIQQPGGTVVMNLALQTTGKINNTPNGATTATGTAVLAINTWYRISISYFVTNTTTFAFKVYVNGVLDSTANAGTMANITSNKFRFLMSSPTSTTNHWFDNAFTTQGVASSSSQPDTGDIRITAKRPLANGTTNGFTSTGAGSGYGTGNAVFVNEQPLSTASFVSVVAAGATTEEYNIEKSTVGDVNINGGNIVDVCGWLYASALLAETASMVINNLTSNVALTSTNTMFKNYAGATAYPAGTGTDIGLITSALATTVTLYEAGILIAYKPQTGQGFFNLV